MAETPRFPFPDFPTGWFAVATSEALEPGQLLTLRYFGQDLVAFRTESGEAFVSEAYCPHLGAHLGHGGKVEGECLRCPFHAWKFDGRGDCVEVPYSDRIPPKAALKVWPTLEQDGVIHAFYAREGEAPWTLPSLELDDWTPAKLIHWPGLRSHPQEVFENTVDITHIAPVHDGRGARILGKPTRDGPHMHLDIEFEASGELVGMPEQMNDVHLDVNLHGLGCVVVKTHVRNAGVWAIQRIYVTPVEEEVIDIRGLIHVKNTEDPEFTAELAELFYQAYVSDFAKDFPIWENKRYLTRPVLAKGDGPVGIYRRWCTQFYGPSAARVDTEPKRQRAREGAAPEPGPRRDLPIAGARLLRRVADVVEPLQARIPAPVRGVAHSLAARLPWLASGGPAPAEDEGLDDDWSPEDAPAPGTAAAEPTESRAGVGGGGPRVASAREYFETLDQRFVPTAARGVDAVFQWELGGSEGATFHALVRDGEVDIREGAHSKPTATLVMAAEDYIRVVNGELDGMRAFASGKGKVKGSVRAAMKMRDLFPA